MSKYQTYLRIIIVLKLVDLSIDYSRLFHVKKDIILD